MAEVKRVPYPGVDGAPSDNPQDMSHMTQISDLISRLQATLEQFGNSCVYIRRGGLSWGAVALNRRSDDEKFGLFDIQAQHGRDMLERLGQIDRLIADRNSEREERWKLEKALTETDKAMRELFKRLNAAGIDCSDLIS